MQMVSGLMSCVLGALGFAGCTAGALCANFVNPAFPFEREVDFGSCRHGVCLVQAPLLQELDIPVVLLTGQLCTSACHPLLSPAQPLGSAEHRWKGHAIPQHPLQESREDGEVSSCQGNTCYLSKLPGGLTLGNECQFSDVYAILPRSLFLSPLPHFKSHSGWQKR